MNNLKKKTIWGLIWKYAEQLLAQLVSTVVSIILARILEPSHYGEIALVNVFITICNVFVITGLGESLIQKKDADELDFSTIFYANVFLSVLLYAILFFTAPLISGFYGDSYPNLTLLVRVMGLRLIVAAVNSVQNAKISREMSFKKYFWATLIGTVTSAVVGIVMALKGYGVWALVAQYLTNTVIDTILLYFIDGWRPIRAFSMQRLRPLLQYGGKILFTALINTIYREFRSLIIGKKYSSEDLAYYNKGSTYPKLIVNNLLNAIGSVLFPAFAGVQDDVVLVKRILQKSLKVYTFFVLPMVSGMAVVASPMIELLLTKKWLPAVPYLQLICIVYAILPLSESNMQCMTALGYSTKFLRINLVKKLIAVIVLLSVFQFGVVWIVISQVFSTLIDYFIDAYFTGKIIGYSLKEQIKDIMPNIIITGIMTIAVMALDYFVAVPIIWLKLFILIFFGVIMYCFLSVLSKNDTFFYVIETIKNFKNSKDNN